MRPSIISLEYVNRCYGLLFSSCLGAQFYAEGDMRGVT